MASNIERAIVSIISCTVKEATGADIQLAKDQSLIDSGILDSLSIVNVIKKLQAEFNIEITGGDITLDNFDTIDAMTSFVAARLG